MKSLFLLLIGLLLLISTPAAAENISVEVIADQGYIFPTYPVRSDHGGYRAYLQAKRNAYYSIRIKNHTDRRVGVVVTVDGRNIISGKKSYLRNTERMYILDPYDVATYRGWRTGNNRINRFYFTNEGDSYADAWGDNSAMGVIAVAAFPEKIQRIRRPSHRARRYSHRAAPSARSGREYNSADSAAGTGYGAGEHSSSVRVEFRPEHRPMEKHFYKYEWRKTLCRKGIISCRRPRPHRDRNRFWRDDDGYAPPPPRYNRDRW
jgi:hypothetical protein